MELEQAVVRIKQLETELAAAVDRSAKQQLEIAALQKTIADKDKHIAEQQNSIEALLAAQRQYEHVKKLAGEVIKQQQQQVENLERDLALVKEHLEFVKKQFDDHSQHHLIQTLCNSKTLMVAQAKRSKLQKLCEQQEAQLKVMKQLLSVHKSSPAGALPVSIQANPVTVAAPKQPSRKVKTAAANKLLAAKTSSNRSKVITAVKPLPAADSVQAPGTPTTGNSRATLDSGVIRSLSNRSSSNSGATEGSGLGWLGTAAASVVGSINTARVSSNTASTTSSCPGSPNTSSSSTGTDSSITTFSSWWSLAANMLMEPADSSSEPTLSNAATAWW